MNKNQGITPLPLFLISAILPKGSRNSKSKISSDDDLDDILEPLEELQSDSRDGKFDEIEGTINEIKDQLEGLDGSNRHVKEELTTIKDDIVQVGKSINNLLCVYEVVSKEYNPFVDSKPDGNIVDEPLPVHKKNRYDENTIIPSPEGFLHSDDKVIKVKQAISDPNLENDNRQYSRAIGQQEEVPAKEPERPSMGSPNPVEDRLGSAKDSMVLQIHRLVISQMDKILLNRIGGVDIDESDIEILEYWFEEFKRLGMK